MVLDKEKIGEKIRVAVRNCNRNLYEWMNKGKRGPRFIITYTEATGLVRNWITRSLRDVVGIPATNRILRWGNLCISVSDDYVDKMYLSSPSSTSYYSDEASILNEVFNSIDYKSLRYHPEEYEDNGVIMKDPYVDMGIKSAIDSISFASIERIKF